MVNSRWLIVVLMRPSPTSNSHSIWRQIHWFGAAWTGRASLAPVTGKIFNGDNAHELNHVYPPHFNAHKAPRRSAVACCQRGLTWWKKWWIIGDNMNVGYQTTRFNPVSSRSCAEICHWRNNRYVPCGESGVGCLFMGEKLWVSPQECIGDPFLNTPPYTLVV